MSEWSSSFKGLTMKGLLIAAPQTNSGKTIFTLGLLRALTNKNYNVTPYKCGPDYIDTAFHQKAARKKSYNLDPWAMKEESLQFILTQKKNSFSIIEGMMGLFDGAQNMKGSTADLAAFLQIPIILILNCEKQSHSLAALLYGFQNFRKDIHIAGVILNKIKSAKQELQIRSALQSSHVKILGVIYENCDLILKSRHLGLVQAVEYLELDDILEKFAEIVEKSVDLEELISLGERNKFSKEKVEASSLSLEPLGQHVAIAKDEAFSFFYNHILSFWKSKGAEISFFSPLNDEGPHQNADAIFLPGGYPEFYASQLSQKNNFKKKIKENASQNKLIYGECGGYILLGESFEDQNGLIHEMLNLLPHKTTIKKPKLHLGYRKAVSPFLWKKKKLFMHEFHYSESVLKYDKKIEPLFHVKDASDQDLPAMGLKKGNVMGSYLHIIDACSTIK